MRQTQPLIFFDYDGVIQNSMPAIHAGVQAVCRGEGKREVSYEEFYSTFDVPVWPYYRETLGITAPDEAISTWFFDALATHYPATRPFAGIKSSLRHLAERNPLMMIISGSKTEDVHERLKTDDIEDFFDTVHGDTVEKAPVLRELCKKYGKEPRHAFFVGDLPADVRDGNTAGVTTIAFTGGMPSRRAFLERAQPDHCVDSHSEVYDIIMRTDTRK